ncbi:carbonic anhydrase 14-like isoform X2 [Salvelinus fontinalis]|uniref:carbonic anhydrase 14-like isoform X2 n=1 Tax=Salvelinus fontinalis TaxID=8038 RepID=UPI002485EB08|nr:carbonic anhydrase 14-like isoform X2 [Salvelinus fontinalis]
MDLVGLSLPLLLVFWQWTTTTGAAGSVGQSKWADYFPDCGGKAQSPVDVATVQTQYDPCLGPLTPLGYSQHGNKPFSLYNNGHTVVVPLPGWMGLGGLPWQFTAVQMHLHWGNGAPEAGGSEHTINGQSSAAELHVVHYNSELYPNMSVAMTQQDGLAVLGVLIETGEEANQAFWNILNYLGRVRHAGQSVSIPAFDVQSLLPSDLGRYYRYNGSLTTPPCFQSVLWTLFTETVKISHTQLMKLETVLYASKEDADRVVMQDNYRTPQPLNDRTILSSFPLESVKVYTAGEITAIVIGALCGCVGLAVIIRFIVKTIRFFKHLHNERVLVNSSTSSWDVLPSVRPAPVPRTKEPGKELKQDVALNTTSEPGKKEDPVPSSV